MTEILSLESDRATHTRRNGRRFGAVLLAGALAAGISGCGQNFNNNGDPNGVISLHSDNGNDNNGGGDNSSGHSYKVNFKKLGADACFTASQSTYVGGWPSDSAKTANAAARCVVDKVWGDDQWPSEKAVLTQESSSDDSANDINPSGGACGLGQALPCSKMGTDHSLKAQVEWMINYIWVRYGNPDAAEAHEQNYHWY